MQQNLGHVLNGCPAPIHAEDRAVDVGGVVTGREGDGGGDFCRGAHPPRRKSGQHGFDMIGELLLTIRGDRTRATALTRTPCGPYSSAQDWANEWIVSANPPIPPKRPCSSEWTYPVELDKVDWLIARSSPDSRIGRLRKAEALGYPQPAIHPQVGVELGGCVLG
jgi:hypothetical protein